MATIHNNVQNNQINTVKHWNNKGYRNIIKQCFALNDQHHKVSKPKQSSKVPLLTPLDNKNQSAIKITFFRSQTANFNVFMFHY